MDTRKVKTKKLIEPIIATELTPRGKLTQYQVGFSRKISPTFMRLIACVNSKRFSNKQKLTKGKMYQALKKCLRAMLSDLGKSEEAA